MEWGWGLGDGRIHWEYPLHFGNELQAIPVFVTNLCYKHLDYSRNKICLIGFILGFYSDYPVAPRLLVASLGT